MTAVKGFRPEINFQDLGGYTAIDGRAVRNGLLYRSSAPGLMNEEELNLLRDMSIHTMMDFRSRKRCEKLPDPELEGYERIQMCAAFESLSDDLNGSFTEFFRMLADENKTVGRIDGRFIGPSTGTELGDGSADPSEYETDAAFSSALNRYLTEELGYQTDIPYLVMNPDLEGKWTFQGENVKLAQEDILYKTISKNSHLKVWVMCGYYDLATPFFCAEWTYDHIFLNEENAHQLQFTYYPSGHMIYQNQESLAQFKEEAKVWYQN